MSQVASVVPAQDAEFGPLALQLPDAGVAVLEAGTEVRPQFRAQQPDYDGVHGGVRDDSETMLAGFCEQATDHGLNTHGQVSSGLPSRRGGGEVAAAPAVGDAFPLRPPGRLPGRQLSDANIHQIRLSKQGHLQRLG